MGNFLTKLALDFFVAFGVVLGASMLAGIGAILTLQPPTLYMRSYAESMKIWAMVAAIGGTTDPIWAIGTNFLEGQLSPAVKQIFYILSAFIGANACTQLIFWICGGGNEY